MQQHDKRQKKTIKHTKLSTKTEHNARPKETLRYWEGSIYRRRRKGGNWWAQLQYGGRRERFSLRTPVQHVAAERARNAYLALASGKDWDEVLAPFKPERVSASGDASTIGDFIGELEEKKILDPKKLRGYATAFRKIVADAFGLDGGKEKFDYRSGGHQRWIERIHAVKLRDVTPEIVQQWKSRFIEARDNPIGKRAARVSVNSIMRCAKTLFSPKVTKLVSRVQLPSPLPFEGIEFEPRQSMRYRSVIDDKKLIAQAQAELAPNDEPVFLAFVLALGAGLRRLEIDRLEWTAFRWGEGVIRIEPTEYFDPKTEHSIGDVAVDPDLMAIMRRFAAKARSNFVIDSPNLPLQHATCQNYRAHKVFKRLSAWLRAKGINSQKPIHELRKEFGSMVNRKHGLTSASHLLRHGGIAIMAAHYIDRPRQATSGIGALLKATQDGKIVPLEQKPATGNRRGLSRSARG
jgi:integrase